MVIGCGQCGGRIADEFALMNKATRLRRGVEVLTNAIAVNTDIADLSGLSHIRSDYRHRILIGSKKTGGHGVGKINELGAELAREDGDKVIESINETPRLTETDAFLIIAGAAGGTGSGAVAVLTQLIKERYRDKPVYNLIALPFRYEEMTEERCIYNVGTCLKSAYLVADAVILVDNQRYIRRNISIRGNLAKINHQMVRPFYNLLCAGEETDPKYIGARVLDAGDIIETLEGWTAIGYGESRIPRVRLPVEDKLHFRDKVTKTQRGVQAIDDAVAQLSIKVNPRDARKALYLLTAPPEEMNMDLINDLSASLKNVATEAIIRSGDYPRAKRAVEVTVVLSDLINARKVMEYFARTIDYISITKRRRGVLDYEHKGISEAFRDIPSLL
ncbi:cell division protein FtsZ [Candidatus Bathyarchaeota archaeon]|nr:MAG: cell division protein FtsZ [Candidatus Bathyarchaeota archaeon]